MDSWKVHEYQETAQLETADDSCDTLSWLGAVHFIGSVHSMLGWRWRRLLGTSVSNMGVTINRSLPAPERIAQILKKAVKMLLNPDY